ncbi:hypothetical protein SUDANB105_07789 [Streptomyces sp. enrichment culture]
MRRRIGERGEGGTGAARRPRRRAARLHGHPARQDFADDWKGTIEPGELADLCALDRPLRGLDPRAVAEVKVDLTVLDGRVAFERHCPSGG